jgi:2-polyprenyl-3-methyl-5-hydroxy-6-metoxy-1,4-benzoquinol methylase
VIGHAKEIAQGERFEFGENWSRFLDVLDDERIFEAEKSLKQMLEVEDLAGKSFLDIGSGSGLFSLAARRLGARVHSFDYDPQSVASTRELRRRYFPEDADWSIEEGSILDEEYVRSLGKFDIVYSWGSCLSPSTMIRDARPGFGSALRKPTTIYHLG